MTERRKGAAPPSPDLQLHREAQMTEAQKSAARLTLAALAGRHGCVDELKELIEMLGIEP